MHARLVSLLVIVAFTIPAAGQVPPLAEQYLTSGRLTEGEAALAEHLRTHPGDDQARFGLGATQFVHAVQRLSAGFHRYGMRRDSFGGMLPFFRLPVPPNPHPDPIAYDDLRAIFQTWLDDMAAVDRTLAGIKDPNVKLPLDVSRIRLDLDGDGRATEGESLGQILAVLTRGGGAAGGAAARPSTRAQVGPLLIAFDAADVHWLRGYAHLLSALPEMMLAYDERDLFERTAQLVFQNPKSPYDFLAASAPVDEFGGGVAFSDVIAFVHLFHFQVKEPARVTAALHHLQAMIAESRQSWALVLAETDNDREWIPSPRQDTVLPNMKVTDDMVKGWAEFLDQADAVLAGRQLIPFWRTKDGRGVNLNKVFTDPRPFDLVLWVQGTAATPYLERGPLASGATWDRLQRTFRGEFFTFAVWFN